MQVREKVLQLAGREAEVHPFCDELVAFVPISDDANTRGRHHGAQRGAELDQASFHRVNHELHAVSGVNHQHHIKPDFTQAADIVTKSTTEAPNRAANAANGIKRVIELAIVRRTNSDLHITEATHHWRRAGQCGPLDRFWATSGRWGTRWSLGLLGRKLLH